MPAEQQRAVEEAREEAYRRYVAEHGRPVVGGDVGTSRALQAEQREGFYAGYDAGRAEALREREAETDRLREALVAVTVAGERFFDWTSLDVTEWTEKYGDWIEVDWHTEVRDPLLRAVAEARAALGDGAGE